MMTVVRSSLPSPISQQSLAALLWTPLMTIWKLLAVAGWSSNLATEAEPWEAELACICM